MPLGTPSCRGSYGVRRCCLGPWAGRGGHGVPTCRRQSYSESRHVDLPKGVLGPSRTLIRATCSALQEPKHRNTESGLCPVGLPLGLAWEGPQGTAPQGAGAPSDSQQQGRAGRGRISPRRPPQSLSAPQMLQLTRWTQTGGRALCSCVAPRSSRWPSRGGGLCRCRL